MKKGNEDKYRVSTMLSKVEKEYLQIIAARNGRSMASHLRFLLLETIDEDED